MNRCARPDWRSFHLRCWRPASRRSPVRYADKIGHRWILAVGSAACGVGYLSFIVLLDAGPGTWTVFMPVSLLVGFGRRRHDRHLVERRAGRRRLGPVRHRQRDDTHHAAGVVRTRHLRDRGAARRRLQRSRCRQVPVGLGVRRHRLPGGRSDRRPHLPRRLQRRPRRRINASVTTTPAGARASERRWPDDSRSTTIRSNRRCTRCASLECERGL